MRPKARPILLLALLGGLVHGGIVLASWIHAGRVDAYALRSLDAREYLAIARNLADYGTFSQSGRPPLAPDTWRTPGYPLLLAFLVLILGDSAAALVLAQQVLGVVNVLLFYCVIRAHTSERRATVAAMLFLIEPYGLYYSLWLLSTTWFVTVLLVTWLAWQRALRSGRWPWYTALGAAGGFLVLIRPVALLVPIALLCGLIFAALRMVRPADPTPYRRSGGVTPVRAGDHSPALASLRGSVASPLACIAVFVLASGLVVGSWMLRNRLVAGHFALSSQAGVVLAYFKATEVILWREGRTEDRYLETSLDPARADDPHPVWDSIDQRLQERFAALPDERRENLTWVNLAQGNRTSVDSFEISQVLWQIGLRKLLARPLDTAVCYAVRGVSLLTFPLNLAVRPPKDVQVDLWAALAKGALYVLLFVAVLVRLLRGGLAFEHAYFPLACTVALLVAVAPQLDPRFRVPMIPLLLAVALLPKREKRDGYTAVTTAR